DLLLLLVPLVHREVDDPTELEAALVDQAKFLADARACQSRELSRAGRLVGRKEHGVPGLDPGLAGDAALHVGRNELCDRPLASLRLEHDVAEAGRTHLALRP